MQFLLSLPIVILLPVTACAEDHSAVPGIEDVVSAQEAWKAQFSSIRVQWRYWIRSWVTRSWPELSADVTLEDSPVYHWEEFWWSDVGVLSHETRSYRFGELNYRNRLMRGLLTHETFSMRDRRRGWGAAMPMQMQLYALNGLWEGSGGWFTEQLRSSESVRIVGEEAINGQRCVVLELLTENVAARGKSSRRFWIDMAIGGLPRKYHFVSSGSDIAVAGIFEDGLTSNSVWTAEEFREVADGVLFPVRGSYCMMTTRENLEAEWIIEQVELNPLFSAAYFRRQMNQGKEMNALGEVVALQDTGEHRISPPANQAASRVSAADDGRDGVLPMVSWRAYGILCAAVYGLLCLWQSTVRCPRAEDPYEK